MVVSASGLVIERAAGRLTMHTIRLLKLLNYATQVSWQFANPFQPPTMFSAV